MFFPFTITLCPPQQRAKKIVALVRRIDSCYSNPTGLHDKEYLLNPITAQITEAEWEAVDKYKRLPTNEWIQKGFTDGFRAAREKAVAILEEDEDPNSLQCAVSIRAMEP